MLAVIFEFTLRKQNRDRYFDLASELATSLKQIDGFISLERFESLTSPDKYVSLQFWRDETAIEQWRNLLEHRRAQAQGRGGIFESYRLRVAQVTRDYSENNRDEAPADSRALHDQPAT